MRTSIKLIYFTVIFLLLISCGSKQVDEKLISVTIEPQRFFAERIAGDKFKIHPVVPVGQSPETYDPTPQQMIQIGKSIAYLQIGYIGFEQAWIGSIKENNPELTFFDLSEGMELLTEDEDIHSHENCNGHHDHGGVDPHIWSSINGAKTIAWNTLNAFIALDKENTAYYWQNYHQLMTEIEDVEKTITQLLTPLTNRTFIIYHPALTYFAHEFNLTQLCIELDGKEPSPAQLKQLVDVAKQHQAKIVFIQQEFDQKNAELIAKETNCRLVRINPLDYYWDKEMIHISKALSDE